MCAQTSVHKTPTARTVYRPARHAPKACSHIVVQSTALLKVRLEYIFNSLRPEHSALSSKCYAFGWMTKTKNAYGPALSSLVSFYGKKYAQLLIQTCSR